MSHNKARAILHTSVEEANPQPQSPAVDNPYWRQELEDLDRYFPRPTPKEAEQYADEELRKHDGIINQIETQLAQLKTMMSEPYANQREKQTIARKIESVEADLADAQRRRQRSINLCGAAIRSSKECEPKRARWEELTKRRQRIDKLTSTRPRGW